MCPDQVRNDEKAKSVVFPVVTQSLGARILYVARRDMYAPQNCHPTMKLKKSLCRNGQTLCFPQRDFMIGQLSNYQ
jgi:hypothetical protein